MPTETFSTSSLTVDSQPHAREIAMLRQELERALQAQAELLSVVSHDMRGPLGVIKLATEVLLGTASEDEAAQKARRRVESIRRSANQMTRLISELMDAASIDDGSLVLDLQPQQPAALLREAALAHESQARSKSITLYVQVEPELRAFVCDRERVLNVLSQLLDNMLKLSPEGGSVELRIESRQPADQTAQNAACVCISISGRARGTTPEAQAKLFDRCHAGSTHERGPRRNVYGRGLSLARDLIEAHGGRIRVKGAPDSGCCFELELPA